jgi:hypothetical protein
MGTTLETSATRQPRSRHRNVVGMGDAERYLFREGVSTNRGLPDTPFRYDEGARLRHASTFRAVAQDENRVPTGKYSADGYGRTNIRCNYRSSRSIRATSVEGATFNVRARRQSVVNVGCRMPRSIWLTKVRSTCDSSASASCESPLDVR